MCSDATVSETQWLLLLFKKGQEDTDKPAL